jgi:hypothetical protein
MQSFEIKNRWTDNVQFTAEIECDENASYGLKLGLAVRAAHKSRAVLRRAVLSDADLSGAVLRDAVLSGADLSGADLRGADLSGAVLSGANLRDANLRDAYLSDADLSGADLRDADLRGADLRGAYLRDAYLSGACPVKIEHIHRLVYEAASKPDALDMSSWHATDACGTTHCRAGWVVHLAGDAGRALEWAMGTPAAAAMIYMASDPTLEKVPDFYCSNEAALEDMKRLAGLEAERSKPTQDSADA